MTMRNKYFNEERKNWCLIDGEENVQEYDEMISLESYTLSPEKIDELIKERYENPKYILLGEGYGMNYTTDGELRVWKDRGVFYKYSR